MTTTAEPRLTVPEQKNADLLEEIDFLLSCDLGEAGILHAIGYTGRPEALKRRLQRLHRKQLAFCLQRFGEVQHARVDGFALRQRPFGALAGVFHDQQDVVHVARFAVGGRRAVARIVE